MFSIRTGSSRLQFRMLKIFTPSILTTLFKTSNNYYSPNQLGLSLELFIIMMPITKRERHGIACFVIPRQYVLYPLTYYCYYRVMGWWWCLERFDLGYMDACEVLDCLWHRGWLWAWRLLSLSHPWVPCPPPAPPLPLAAPTGTLL